MNDAQLLTLVSLSIADYAPIRDEYRNEVWAAIQEYLYTEGTKVTRFQNAMKRAAMRYFSEAFAQGIADGGGADYMTDPDPDDVAWLASRQRAEEGYITQLFQSLKDLKAGAVDDPTILEGEADRRADGYTKTLDAIYTEGKLRAKKNIMLTFDGTDGQESCPECQRYKGKSHRAKWWIAKDIKPGSPGCQGLSCHGYNCKHFLWNSKTGEIYTI